MESSGLTYPPNNGPVILFVFEPANSDNPMAEGSLRFISNNTEDILGYRGDECVDRPGWWPNHMHSEDWSSIISLLNQNQGEISLPCRMRSASGDCIPGLLTLTSVREKSEKTVLYGVWLPDTDTRDESVQSDAGDLYRILFNSSITAIFVLQKDIVVECNRAALDLFGHERGRIIGRPIHELLSPSGPDAEGARESVGPKIEAAYSGEPQLLEINLVNAAGVDFDVELSLIRVDLDTGPHIKAVVRDITHRKNIERALARSAENQRVLHEILSLTMDDASLEEHLDRALGLILSISWFQILPQAGIYLSRPNDSGELFLAARTGQSESADWQCPTIPVTDCLCSRAYLTGDIQVCEGDDGFSEIPCLVIEDHDSYSVPLSMGDRCIGVMILYFAKGLDYGETEFGFLKTIGQTLATMIEGQRAAQSLTESEAQVRAIVDTAVEGIITIDSDGLVRLFNHSAEKIFGHRSSEVLGRNVNMLQPEPSRSRHDSYIKQYLSTGRAKVIGSGREIEGQKKDGTTFPLYLSVSEFRLGERVYFTGILRDITEVKQTEKALKEVRDSLAEAQAIAHVGNWDWDIERDTVYWSDEIYRIFGLEPSVEPVTYEVFLELVHPDDRDRVFETIRAALKKKEQYEIEHRLIRPDGSHGIVVNQAEVIPDSIGRPVRMVGTVQDVTERKKAEVELIRARQTAEMYAQDLKDTLEVSESLRQALDQELGTAAELQHQLLPQKEPLVPGISFAWDFTPSEAVSGDLFNIFLIDKRYLVLYILDVSGHGVPSALLTFSISQSLNPVGEIIVKDDSRPLEPARVLKELDRQFPLERFDKTFSIIYTVLDLETGILTYANAGHPPGFLVLATGEIKTLEIGGTLIGLGEIIPFEQEEIHLAKGDRFLLYTDGVSECPAFDGSLFGEVRLRRIVKETIQEPLPLVIQSITWALEDFSSGILPQDDITLVALECEDPPWESR